MITKPLLAEELVNFADVKFPVMVSAKLDGIRCLKVNGKILSRSFKPIPNNYIRNKLELVAVDGMDGEILTFTDGKLDQFNTIQSKVMSEDGEPEFEFAVFDFAENLTDSFKDRYERLTSFFYANCIKPVHHVWVHTLKELEEIEEELVEAEHEGIMLRSPEGRYKCGRSTLKEGYLLKYKRFLDGEAIILEIREQETNVGERGINELGRTKRSYKKADKVLAGTMGEFWVIDKKLNIEFGIGTGIGLTKELRKELWNNKDKYIGRLLKYKYQKVEKNKPRFPSFLGFRNERDLS